MLLSYGMAVECLKDLVELAVLHKYGGIFTDFDYQALTAELPSPYFFATEGDRAMPTSLRKNWAFFDAPANNRGTLNLGVLRLPRGAPIGRTAADRGSTSVFARGWLLLLPCGGRSCCIWKPLYVDLCVCRRLVWRS